jgi:hypothetical protein
MTLADHIKLNELFTHRNRKLKKWAYKNAWLLLLCFMVVVVVELALILAGLWDLVH